MSSDDHVTVRDWRRRRPLWLRVTTIAPYIIRWGPDGWRDTLRRAAGCAGQVNEGLTL